jgi:hypothetical protein
MKRYDPLAPPDPQEWLALDELDRISLIEDYHRRAQVRLPNRRVHAIIHAIIENQAALADETPVRRTLERLMAEGLDRHDAVHAVGLILTDFFHDVMTGAAPTDVDPNPEYFAAVERVTAAGWRQWAHESADSEIDIPEMVLEFAGRNAVPVEAIEAARAQRAVAVPAFLRIIERYLDGEANSNEENALLVIFHLLGEWREQSAYRPLAEMLRRSPDQVDHLLGEAIAQTIHRVMAGVFDGDPQPLYDIIMDANADQCVRSRMFDALLILVLRNELPRAEFIRFLQVCYADMRPRKDDGALWTGWAHAIATLGIVELRPLVEQAFERGFIPGYAMRLEHFEEDIQRGIDHPGALPNPDDDDLTLINDAIDQLPDLEYLESESDGELEGAFDDDDLEDWGGHDDPDELADHPERRMASVPASNPFKGVGRNDPCPCGSGKKFKKCCLNKAAA